MSQVSFTDLESQHIEFLPARTTLTGGGTAIGGAGGNGGTTIIGGIGIGILNAGNVTGASSNGGSGGSAVNY